MSPAEAAAAVVSAIAQDPLMSARAPQAASLEFLEVIRDEVEMMAAAIRDDIAALEREP